MKYSRLLFAMAISLAAQFSVNSAVRLDELAVAVDGQREYSFSDKSAGFYYGMTGVDNWQDGNAGWNIESRRVFVDYQLFLDGRPLEKSAAKTEVFPYKIVRDYGVALETFYLLDDKKAIIIEVQSEPGHKIGLSLDGNIISAPEQAGSSAICRPSLHKEKVVRVGAINGVRADVCGARIETESVSGGFILAFDTEGQSQSLLEECRSNYVKMLTDRKLRMQSLLDANSLATNSDGLDKALPWIMLTADELVTWQHGGWGIYAGLPWFTDFWGRDMFIAMPGTILCTGQFDVAKNILLSFAKYQDLDKASATYGRVPNRLNLDGILYNTTDGTPRFVMQVLDYLKYTGDVGFIKSIYENVRIATDASLALYVDDKGYLTHADADTWMDAKRQGKYPCSPRGNRAVDIQALWYGQLTAAARIADFMGKKQDAKRWRAAAEKLKNNFGKDFVVDGTIVDHLNADGSADRQLRPNTMYAYDLIDSDSLKSADIRRLWSHLTYPWGVSSLDQMDDQFHPYHEQWHRYHKDDAYHNGTVWLWQNGMAMQRLIEYGQVDMAYQLFENMDRQALHEGAVGSLSECADAWCRPGHTWARRSGTFLQSWSNSEQLRVWNQCFLGVCPDLIDGKIRVAPRLPAKLSKVEAKVEVGAGSLRYEYKRYGGKQFLALALEGVSPVELEVNLPEYATTKVRMSAGQTIELEWNADALTLLQNGKESVLTPDSDKVARIKADNKFFEGMDFAEPCYREDLKSMSRYFNPQLDYYSVE